MASSQGGSPPSPLPPNNNTNLSPSAGGGMGDNVTHRGSYYLVLPTMLDTNEQHLEMVRRKIYKSNNIKVLFRLFKNIYFCFFFCFQLKIR